MKVLTENMQHILRPDLIAVIVFVCDIFCHFLKLEHSTLLKNIKDIANIKALTEKVKCNLDSRVNIVEKHKKYCKNKSLKTKLNATLRQELIALKSIKDIAKKKPRKKR